MWDRFEQLLKINGIKVADVVRGTGIHQTTFSHWKQGEYTPKQDKIQKIADYFGVPVSYFYDDHIRHNKEYHYDSVTEAFAQALRDDQKALMRSTANLTPDEVKAVDLFIKALKGEAEK